MNRHVWLFWLAPLLTISLSTLAQAAPGTPRLAPAPASPYAPAAADVFIIEDSLSIFEDEQSRTSVIGEVRNNGEMPAATVFVEFAAFDAAGNLVDTAGTSIMGTSCTNLGGYLRHDCLLPGEVGWFMAVLWTPGGEEITRIDHAARGFADDLTVPDLNLEIAGIEVLPGLTFAGTVNNLGATDVVGLRLTAAVRNAEGRLIAITGASPSGESIGGYGGGIRAGEAVPFSLSSPVTAADYASVEFKIGGQEYSGGNFRYAVPGVAHTIGIDETVWRSSLALANLSGVEGHATLSFFYQGQRITVEVTIADNQGQLWDDVVATRFGSTGDAAGFVRIDSDVPLTVTARTYNQLAQGGYGQLLPTLTPITTGQWRSKGVLSPVRGGENFRTNIGLVNLSAAECAVAVRLFDLTGSLAADLGEITIGPDSWRQLNDVVPDGLAVGYAILERATLCSTWAYASLIDRDTGDPTMITIVPETTIHANPVVFGPTSPGAWGWSPWKSKGHCSSGQRGSRPVLG